MYAFNICMNNKKFYKIIGNAEQFYFKRSDEFHSTNEDVLVDEFLYFPPIFFLQL